MRYRAIVSAVLLTMIAIPVAVRFFAWLHDAWEIIEAERDVNRVIEAQKRRYQ